MTKGNPFRGSHVKTEYIFGLQTIGTPNRSAQTHPESTHFAAMIYHRKTLFSSGPKLTAVQYSSAKR